MNEHEYTNPAAGEWHLIKPERKEYLVRLIESVRQDFLQPVEVIDGEPVFDGKYLDVALLCDVVEKEVLK